MADEATTPAVGAASADDSLANALGANASQGEVRTLPDGDTPPAADAATPESSDGAESGDEASIETYDQLAEALGVSPEDLGTIKVKLKVDGEDHDATLAELIKINQLEGHVNRKSVELSEKQKAWESEVGKVRSEWQQRVSFAAQIADAQEAQLNQQYQSVNWQALAQQDPQQYTTLRMQFQDAANQIAYQKQALAQHYQQTQQQMRAQLQPRALEQIHAQNPDLSDAVTYGNAVAEIKSYLKGVGANESNFDAVEMDPVVFRITRDAARYAALANKRPAIAKKVEAAPKFEKASPRVSGNTHAKTYERAMKGDEDAMASLLAS
ncbi:MAG TPA: hypothetical protein VF284_09405 [Rhodanobacteraceae bacterium]